MECSVTSPVCRGGTGAVADHEVVVREEAEESRLLAGDRGLGTEELERVVVTEYLEVISRRCPGRGRLNSRGRSSPSRVNRPRAAAAADGAAAEWRDWRGW